ncbi:MAG: non-canonical purine NTP pyrophosphatase, partial [Clostridia bacterium]|nr:non-canonical purine NTP pyrophosphatase [Clostridia bacterium]
MEKPVLIAATGNPNKIREIKEILQDVFHVISMKDAEITEEAEENGRTFEENALIKARFVSLRTGQAAIADDSGLEVDALGGAPGVYSARYAGMHGDDEANNRLLLSNLKEIE